MSSRASFRARFRGDDQDLRGRTLTRFSKSGARSCSCKVIDGAAAPLHPCESVSPCEFAQGPRLSKETSPAQYLLFDE